MPKNIYFYSGLLVWILVVLNAQIVSGSEKGKLGIEQDTIVKPKKKVKFAEPVVEDFVTDLVAEKGAINLNGSLGFTDYARRNNILIPQLEFEFAPLNRLAFEIQMPYLINIRDEKNQPKANNRIPSIQWTGQYTFLVSEKRKIALALNYRNRFSFKDSDITGQKVGVENISHLPYVTAAKNWKDKYFISFQGGTEISQTLDSNQYNYTHQIVTAFHQQIGRNDHYWGVEIGKYLQAGDFTMIVRPQLFFKFFENYTLGLAVGVPFWNPSSNWMSFARLTREF